MKTQAKRYCEGWRGPGDLAAREAQRVSGLGRIISTTRATGNASSSPATLIVRTPSSAAGSGASDMRLGLRTEVHRPGSRSPRWQRQDPLPHVPVRAQRSRTVPPEPLASRRRGDLLNAGKHFANSRQHRRGAGKEFIRTLADLGEIAFYKAELGQNCFVLLRLHLRDSGHLLDISPNRSDLVLDQPHHILYAIGVFGRLPR